MDAKNTTSTKTDLFLGFVSIVFIVLIVNSPEAT